MRRKLIVYMIICAVAEFLLSILAVRALGCSSAALMNCVSCSVLSLYSLMVEFQFVSLVIILRQRYAFLNTQLDEEYNILDKGSDEMHKTVVVVGHINGGSYVFNRSISSKINSMMHTPTYNNIMKLHDNLCDIVQEINHAYSPCLVVNAAKTFTTLTYCLYYIIVAYGLGGIRNNSHINVIIMYWIVVLAAKIVFVVCICNSSSNEVSFQVMQSESCKIVCI
jgi:hypothetical protein